MDATALARWQFAITTVYHFLFVPITIGMSLIVACFHLMWVRTHKPEWLRLTKFFGKLFLINFALGLVTGIVQEFQFGMNWSDYSRFVGDIFGAPLAFEALLAFFMESTFLGVWIFGWGRLPEKIHMACIWLVHIGTVLSAYFILAANSFMQNPVGFRFNPDTGRAEMADFLAVLVNKVQLVTFPHVITASYMTGGAVVMGVALWMATKHSAAKSSQRAKGTEGTDDAAEASMYLKATRIGAWVSLVASLLVIVTGDIQGKIMTEVQPMKMAAAEAIYETQTGAPFSILSVGSLDGNEATRIIEVPGLLSFLATGDFNGKVVGINEAREMEKALAAKVSDQYGPQVAALVQDETYTPVIPLTYWTFRLMMGLGFLSSLISIAVLWATRRGQIPQGWFWRQAAIWNPLLPVFAISFGWIFTEIGRQPWIVYGLMTTATGVSPRVSAGEVLFSMVVYTLLYAVLAVIEVKLFLTYVKRGAEPFEDPRDHADADEDAPLQFAY